MLGFGEKDLELLIPQNIDATLALINRFVRYRQDSPIRSDIAGHRVGRGPNNQ